MNSDFKIQQASSNAKLQLAGKVVVQTHKQAKSKTLNTKKLNANE